MVTRERMFDDGGPFPIEVEAAGERTRLAVCTDACSNRECLTLHISVSAVAQGPGGAPVTGEELLLLGYDVEAQRFADRLVREAAADSQGLAERVEAALAEPSQVELLLERYRRLRGVDEPGRQPDGWSPGDLASFSEVFPASWDLVFSHDGARYAADDQHCLTPTCTCEEVVLSFIELSRGVEASVAHVTVGKAVRLGRADPLGRALFAAMLAQVGPKALRERRARVRAFVQGKGRRRAQAKRGLLPERAATEGGASIHQLRLHLLDTFPDVWRRIQVASSTPLGELDRVVRSALGRAAEPAPSIVAVRDDALPYVVAVGPPLAPSTPLARAADGVGARLRLGGRAHGGWTIELLVEDVRPRVSGATYPRTTDGEGALPPRRLSSPGAYMTLLDALEDPASPGHDAAAKELGRDFDAFAAAEPMETSDDDLRDDEPEAAEDIARVLDRAGGLLMDRTRARVRELGDAAVPALLDVLARPPFMHRSRAEPTSAHVLAVRLLDVPGEVRAVRPLLAALTRFPFDSPIGREIAWALSVIGEAAIDPTLAAYADATDPLHRVHLRDALSSISFSDPAIQDALVAAVERDEPLAAKHLGRCGDDDAVPVLRAALARRLEAHRLEEADEAATALEALGADLGEQAGRVARARAALDGDADPPEDARSAARPTAPRLGRNDACWCGSGKKYKKCHLTADEKARASGANR